MRIRQYRTEDHDAVWELHNLVLHLAHAHAGNGAWDDDLHNIEDVYLNDRGEFLVGIVDGQVIAMGALKQKTEEQGEIKRMRVHSDHQRKGYGQAILSALEDRARALGYESLYLDTASLLEAAQALYEKNGFRQTGIEKMAGFDCLLYEKTL